MKPLFLTNQLCLSFVIYLICFCQVAKADWLSVCQNSLKPAQATFQKVYYKSSGEKFWLSISQEKPQACVASVIPSVEHNFLWMGLIASDVANRFGERPILHGAKEDGVLKITEVIPQVQKKIEQSRLYQFIPLNVNTINDIEWRMFGLEERVSIQKKADSLNIQCTEGQKPAGALLKINKAQLPGFPLLNLSLSFRGDANMELGMSDQKRFEKGDPIILGELNAKMSLDHQQYSVPDKINRNSQLHLSIICPKQAGRLLIEDLRFLTNQDEEKVKGRGMWFWHPDLWQKEATKLLEQAHKYNANRVFISIEIDEKNKIIKEHESLIEFLRLAANRNIKVWVVEGDPRVILPVERARFVERSRIYANFNASPLVNEKLAGIQYDIEPYLVSGYALQTESWAQAYVDTIAQLHKRANMPLEIVIPFWWNNQMLNSKSLLDHLAPYVESINIMNYRTSLDLLERFAQPLLAWGVRANRKVSIALEAGPLVEEQQWRFKKAKAGELWRIQVEDFDVLIYLDQAMFNPEARVYKQVASRKLSVDAITFKAKMPELMQLLPNLEQSWENWPSFSGISLHGLDNLE